MLNHVRRAGLWLASASLFATLACTDTPSSDGPGTAGTLGVAAGTGAAGAAGAGTATAGTGVGGTGVGGAMAGAGVPVAGTGVAGTGAAGTTAGTGSAGTSAGTGAAGTTAGTDAAGTGAAGTTAGTGVAGTTAGTTAGTAAAGTNAEPAFMPCPMDEPCKILPFGDSITYGLGYAGAYRVELFRSALEDGKDITFVGSSSMPNGPSQVDGTPFPRDHEGHSGWTISQLDGRVPSPALSDDPHIVLLHIGTNDMWAGPSGAAGRLGTLMDHIIEALPDALLVVSNIIPWPAMPGNVDTYNAGIPPLVEERAAEGKHVIFVDQFTGFPASELGDGIHPNEAGSARMAGVWYEAIRDYLP